jgi:acylphosphatase
MATVCKHVRYSGHVQGVGFRYTAQSLAARRPVAGYVRNLPDGDVELVAEGEPGAVDQFLAAVASRMGEYITTTNVRDIAPAGHSGFHVRH